MRVNYAPGPGAAIVCSRGVVVVARPPDPGIADAILAAIVGGGGVGEVVDAMSHAFGASMSSIPEFGMALQTPGGLGLLVRGNVTATVSGAGGESTVSGVGAATWREAEAAADTLVTIRIADAAGPAGFAVKEGVVPCGLVTVGGGAGGSAPAEGAPENAGPSVSGTPAPEPPVPAAVLEPRAPVGEDTSATLLPEVEAPADEEDFLIWGATELGAPPRAAEPAAPVLPAAPGSAVPAAAAAPAPAAPPPTAAHEPPVPAAPEPAAPVAIPPTPLTEDGMIAGVPSFARASSAPPPADPVRAPSPAASQPAPPQATTVPVDTGDHDGETRVVAKTSGTVPTATAPPPTLRGLLVMSTGQRIPLDRAVVIGRRPKATRTTGDVPTLVAVPSPQQDISRSHLEVRVEGASAVAVDLDTTNGTVLRRAGSEPTRLHPGEPTLLVPGDVLDLGEEVFATYEEA